MYNVKRGVLLAGGLCLAASCLALPARAADLTTIPLKPFSTPAPPPIAWWTGPYAGGYLGAAHAVTSEDAFWSFDILSRCRRETAHMSSTAEADADGIAGGVFAGYNYQVSPFLVVGLEAEIGATSAEPSLAIYGNGTVSTEYGAFGSVRGRIGYAFRRLLVYGTGGLAFADISHPIAGTSGDNDSWRTGYTVGAGVEYAVTTHLFGRAEYLYANYGDVTVSDSARRRADFSDELHLVRVALGYRF
ncbi:porin family protein [Rhodoplanes sp. TEM]|uniref:Porin family protein n=1 Tax=Rhodoplanes tepidamans TaxID=200616 RepID=A0ABT5JDJ6_RHOTP|nr:MULTISPECIES: outer membrane protein [Rhodoplanes]MDC7787582.1 porin family protein [Rhodoplanes tepidamans]MDC7984925.1 porin family protein [Rhodoplanes sp. TEM]MDQ0358010.1 outer membrane immunogenic protein [Rhodoplanes tepidamans]